MLLRNALAQTRSRDTSRDTLTECEANLALFDNANRFGELRSSGQTDALESFDFSVSVDYLDD